MDLDILKTYEDGKVEKLSSYLREVTIEQLRQFVDDRILRHKCVGDPTSILRAIFKGCNSEKNHLSSHFLAIFTHCLKLLTSPDVPQKIGTDILGIILLEVNHLSTGGLVDTSKMIIEMIRSGSTGHGRAIQVLPKVLTCLEQKHEIHLGPGQGTMPGYEYKKHLINTLCSGKWSSKSIIHLANIFKDVPMSFEEMGFFLRKMLRQLERLEMQEIPPLVHQMLPLAGRTHHETLLRGIFAVFTKIDTKPTGTEKNADNDEFWNEMFEIDENGDSEQVRNNRSNNLKMVEGTVLLHLTNMARWDQSLGKVFIKMLKLTKDAISEGSVSTLFLAFALSLSQTRIFREQVLDLLRVMIFRCFSHEHREAHSNWLKQRSVKVPDITKALQDVLDSCKHGWEQVVTGIVYLALCLMDSYGPKAGAFGRPLEGEAIKEDTPQQKCCYLGADMLASVFKTHPLARTEVVEQILNRVITRTSSPISHYIDILKGISKRYPSTLLESKHKLREFFEHICLLSPQNADCVLRSILSLIRINSHLKDSLILVLRKALFSCQLNGRIIACNGFLLLLQNFKVSGYVSLSQASSQSSQSIFSISSQIHVDVHSSAGPSSCQGTNHEPLCLEVLSTLRRCLTQQSPVRAILYQGLWNVIANNPNLVGPIMEKLVQHFRRYYEEHNGIIPPIKTELCVGIQNGDPTMTEPLPLLLSSVFLCLKKADDYQKRGGVDEDDLLDENLVTSIKDAFDSITTRMTKSEMEDFELDKSAEFSRNTSVGKKNSILGNLVMGCYQALIEYNYLQDDLTEETANHILRLHSCYTKIREVVSGGKKESNKGSTSTFSASPTFIKSVIDGLFCDESPDKEVGLNVLRENDDFVKFAVEIAVNAVTYAKDHDFMKGMGGRNKTLVRETCMTVGHACMHKFIQVKNDLANSTIGQSCLDAFHNALQYVVARKKKRLEEFLMSVTTTMDDSTSTSGNVQDRLIRKFQRMIISYLSEDVALSSSHRKILPLLLSVLDTLSSTSCVDVPVNGSRELPRHSSTPHPSGISQMNEWIGKLCTEQVIDDTTITKCLIALHLRLSSACGPWTGEDRAAQGSEGAIRDVTKDIHIVAGDIEPEEEESRMDERKRGSHYSVIDECNVINLVPLVVTHIDSAVEETDWLLQRVKGQVTALLADDKFKDVQDETGVQIENNFHGKRRKLESAMCTRLGNLLIAYRELIQSALPLGPPTESTFRGLTKLFTLLTNFTKYYTWLVAQGVSKTPSPRFEKLIKLTGTEVTRYVYPFINHIESMQSSRNVQAGKKRKRKENEKDAIATNSEKQKVLRETKNIPPLIYAIENMERFLITLGKKCKMDLLSGHKLPTSRDFRIKSAVIKEALARRDEEETQEESEDAEAASESEEDDSVASKRARPE